MEEVFGAETLRVTFTLERQAASPENEDFALFVSLLYRQMCKKYFSISPSIIYATFRGLAKVPREPSQSAWRVSLTEREEKIKVSLEELRVHKFSR